MIIHALETRREMAADSICSCYACCANHVFNVVGEVGGLVKKDVSILGPLVSYNTRPSCQGSLIWHHLCRNHHTKEYIHIFLDQFNSYIVTHYCPWWHEGVISFWKSVIDHHLTPIPNHKPIKQRSLIRCRTQKHPHTLHLPRHYISWCARYNLATNATCPPILGWVSIIVTQGENTLDYIITRAIILGISIGNPKLLQRDSPRVELVTNLRGWGFYYIDYPKCMLLFGVML